MVNDRGNIDPELYKAPGDDGSVPATENYLPGEEVAETPDVVRDYDPDEPSAIEGVEDDVALD